MCIWHSIGMVFYDIAIAIIINQKLVLALIFVLTYNYKSLAICRQISDFQPDENTHKYVQSMIWKA